MVCRRDHTTSLQGTAVYRRWLPVLRSSTESHANTTSCFIQHNILPSHIQKHLPHLNSHSQSKPGFSGSPQFPSSIYSGTAPFWISGTGLYRLDAFPITNQSSTGKNMYTSSLFHTVCPYPLCTDNLTPCHYHYLCNEVMSHFMATIMNRAGHYIFALWFLSSSSIFFSSPNLSGRRMDVYHTSTHDMVLVQI